MGATLSVDAGEGQRASRSDPRTRFGLVTRNWEWPVCRKWWSQHRWGSLDHVHLPNSPGWKETARADRTSRNLGGPVRWPGTSRATPGGKP